MMVRTFAATLAASSSFLATTAAQAGGFYLQEQSAKAVGRAFSGEAADTGPESLWWNPAAIGGIDRGRAYIGLSYIAPRGRLVDDGTLILRPGQPPAPVGGNPVAVNPINNGWLPSGAIAYPLGGRAAIGLAITSPFSFTTDYELNSWVRYTAGKTKLRTIDIQPTIAIAASRWLRIGAGLNVEYSDATLSNALPNLSPLLPDGRQELKGDGWDIGWSAGVQFHDARTTVGLSYKSAIRHKLKGDLAIGGLIGPLAGSNIQTPATATFRTPWQMIAGIRHRVTDRLTFNGQAARIGWSRFDAIRLGPPINAAIPEKYRDTWNAAVGADYAVTPRLTLRAGLQYDQTPTRDGARDARVPDANRWNYAAGASYQLTPAITLDAAFDFVDIDRASIDRPTAAFAGTPAQSPILVSGALENAHAYALAMGARISF